MPERSGDSCADVAMDDAAALRRLADGDESALTELVARHEAALRAYLRHVLADPSFTDDAVQEVFLRILTRANSYDPTWLPRAWLFRIARNLAIDLTRHATRRRAESLEDPGRIDPAPQPSARLEAEEFHSRLRAELAHLPEELATTFVLREIDQMSYTEIAQVMGTGEKTVSTRLHRARLRLRRQLSEWIRETPA